MKQTELLIGQVLRIGLWFSVGIVLVGGSIYLIQHGQELIHYQVFQPETKNLNSVKGIVERALAFSSSGIIQFGLLILVLTQILRMGVTTWFFIQERDVIFAGMSLVILSVLIYSIFWRN